MQFSAGWGLVPVLILAFAGIVTDWRSRRLPNALSALTAASGLGWSFLVAGWPGIGSAGGHVLIAFAACAGLYAIKWIGGGDAKYYAGFAAWFPLSAAPILTFSVAICGGLLALGWLFLRRKIAVSGDKAQADHASMPYGVAIATGAVVAYLLA